MVDADLVSVSAADAAAFLALRDTATSRHYSVGAARSTTTSRWGP